MTPDTETARFRQGDAARTYGTTGSTYIPTPVPTYAERAAAARRAGCDLRLSGTPAAASFDRSSPCFRCRGSHPARVNHPGRIVHVAVDDVTYTLTLSPPYGNQWTFPHPDGSTAYVTVSGRTSVEELACGVRHALAGPHPYEVKDAADAWRLVAQHGDPRLWEGATDAARLRTQRIRAAYRLAYGVATDLEAVRARGADESAYHAYTTPDDRFGNNHRARRYLAAYAQVLAEAEHDGERVFPVERLAYTTTPTAA